jgi:hypothetical protein
MTNPSDLSAPNSNRAYFKAYVHMPDPPSDLKEIATFEFAFADIIPILNALTQQPEIMRVRGHEITKLLAFLQTHNTPESAPVMLYAYGVHKTLRDRVLKGFLIGTTVITDLIEAHIPCKVHCKECGVLYANPELPAETWSYDHGPLASGAGRNWLCPQGHVVFRLQHFRS